MTTAEVRVDAAALRAFTTAVFTAAGVPAADAALEADVLLWANLRGVDSHGVLRIPAYLEMMQRGVMNPAPDIRVIKETAAVLYVDADRALGPVATVPAMRRVMTKAQSVGIGWCLIRNVTHQGAMAYYTLLAAEQGLAGIAFVCSPPNMAPHGARAAGVHNSPIAIAVPAGRHAHLSLDMATSVAAGGKLNLAADKGVALPPGWALDAGGNPTTDAAQAKILLPSGGYKGSGLALMLQCLTSQMAGNPLLLPALRSGRPALREQGAAHVQNSVVAAIDIELFCEPGEFRREIDDLIDALKALPTADGVEEVLVPGEPEERVLRERSRDGIPLPPGTVDKLRGVAERFAIALPPELA